MSMYLPMHDFSLLCIALIVFAYGLHDCAWHFHMLINCVALCIDIIIGYAFAQASTAGGLSHTTMVTTLAQRVGLA